MSAFVLNQEGINILTAATDAALRLNRKYPTWYPLEQKTIDILGPYAGDLHNIYRALYITNIKAVNGRYRENTKTLPKYESVKPWNINDIPRHLENWKLKKACGMYQCYMYQCSEEPIDGSDIYNAFQDIQKLLCYMLVTNTINWEGEEEH